MTRLNGAIEKIDGRFITGWVMLSAGPEDAGRADGLRVIALFDETIVASEPEFFFRPDLGGPFGFRLECPESVDPASVVTRRLHVQAIAGSAITPLRILPHVRSAMVASLVSATMQDFSLDDIDKVRDAIAKLPAAINAAHVAASTSPEKQHTLRLLDRIGFVAAPVASPADLSFLPVNVGFVSPDGTALVGKQGEAYLVGGGNRVLDQFLQPADDPRLLQLVNDWQATVIKRVKVLKESGIRFLQVIIPEKLSVHPNPFPVRINVPSPSLRLLEESLSDSGVSEYLVFGLREFIRALPPESIFPRLDSHLTVQAAYTLFAAQLRVMGLTNPFKLDLSSKCLGVGDLAKRFFGIPLYEEWPMPSQEFATAMSGSLDLVLKEAPVDGHIGTKYVWKNADAPINLKVVAFANSFFERAGSARALSWWFCRAFIEFHFVWSPDLDMNYVRKTAPDWIICQTIERFLPRLPQDIL